MRSAAGVTEAFPISYSSDLAVAEAYITSDFQSRVIAVQDSLSEAKSLCPDGIIATSLLPFDARATVNNSPMSEESSLNSFGREMLRFDYNESFFQFQRSCPMSSERSLTGSDFKTIVYNNLVENGHISADIISMNQIRVRERKNCQGEYDWD
jgi:hypothetical protein